MTDMRVDGTSEMDPEHDYLREQIRKLVQLVARLVGRAALDPANLVAHDELRTEAGRLLGHPYEMLERLTPASAAVLLALDADRRNAYADLVAAEGRLLAHAGDYVGAHRNAARARALRSELDTDDPQPEPKRPLPA